MSGTRAATCAHLAAVVAAVAGTVVAGRPVIWAGMVAFVGPLLVLLTVIGGRRGRQGRQGRDEFARRHAVAALAFNASVAIYLGAIVLGLRLATGSPYTVQFVPFLLFLNLLIGFNWLVFTAIGAQRAATGQTFSYPFTLTAISRKGW